MKNLISTEQRNAMDEILAEHMGGTWMCKVPKDDPAKLTLDERFSRLETAKRMLRRFLLEPRPGDEKYIAFWREEIVIYSRDYPAA